MVSKASDQQAPPDESADITQFGLETLGGVSVHVIAQTDLGPPYLCVVIHCECRMQCKKYSTEECGCDKEHLSCISYSNCSDETSCCNPYTNTEEAQAGDEEGIEMENAEENYMVDKRMTMQRGGQEDVKGGFVDPDYLDDEWDQINYYYEYHYMLSALINMT